MSGLELVSSKCPVVGDAFSSGLCFVRYLTTRSKARLPAGLFVYWLAFILFVFLSCQPLFNLYENNLLRDLGCGQDD